ncbi:MAG: hypothetical protein ACHREM_21845 [Polyangiales bacterium]
MMISSLILSALWGCTSNRAGTADTTDAAFDGSSEAAFDGPADAVEEAGIVFGSSDASSSSPIVNAPDPSGFLVRAVADPSGATGKHSIVLTVSGVDAPVAPLGWVAPPVGVMQINPGPDLDAIVICWNHMTGPEPTPGAMPQPSGGMELLCRYRTAAGALLPTVSIGFAEPSWLKSIDVSAVGISVATYRDKAGTLFGPPSACDPAVGNCDGLYEIPFSTGIAGTPVLVKLKN